MSPRLGSEQPSAAPKRLRRFELCIEAVEEYFSVEAKGEWPLYASR
jgi:hypothetical protein